jgi:hypothetical protein
VDELEKEIADSKQKIDFFRAKMQELVSISASSAWSFLLNCFLEWNPLI